jgi:hypothetical protein
MADVFPDLTTAGVTPLARVGDSLEVPSSENDFPRFYRLEP